MGKAKVDSEGICIDYKCPFCGICARLNTETCCRSVPKYHKRIDSWNQKMKKVSAEATGITLAIEALTSIRRGMLGKLSKPDRDRVEKLIEIAKRQPGIGIRFMHDGVERSCFDCVHCEKTFQDEPCRKCLGGAERYVNLIRDPKGQFERYEYARNFEHKDQSREATIRELAEKYRPMVKDIKRDAKSRNVSVYEILAYMLLGNFGAK